MAKHRIPFNKPYITGGELENIKDCLDRVELSGNGVYAKKCQHGLEKVMSVRKAFLVHSGTAALELGALLLDIKPGDEVIMPSFTFVTAASAITLRGGIPVFVDIRPDTLNIDENLIEAAITSRTKAILPVHYAGVGCEMDTICAIADKHKLKVFEDAAHAVSSTYKGRALGSFGTMAATSFHETKNLTCGEGGAFLINDESLVERAEILVEKGTNRAQFFLGLADKYTWHDNGSSFLASELEAAFLWAQIERAEGIMHSRRSVWQQYYRALSPLEREGLLTLPTVPTHCEHNGHLFYVLLPTKNLRDETLAFLSERGIGTVFHYIPLHQSPAGVKYTRVHGDMQVTEQASERLLRLPLWVGLSEIELTDVVDSIYSFFGRRYSKETFAMINLATQEGSTLA